MRWLLLLLCVSSCAPFTPADRFSAAPLPYERLGGWGEDYHGQALQAFLLTCPFLSGAPRQACAGSGLEIPPELWRDLCADAGRVPGGDNEAARRFFERRFTPYRVANHDREAGLFTGYYVPTLYGSHRKKGDYAHPLYLPPPELASRKPYHTHARINGGALAGQRLELAWVDDPVMRFFLQIQGSGRVRFEDGSEMLVGYAGKNGHPYVSLGKVMGDEGLIAKDQINFYSLRQWLYDNRGRAFEMMERNPSYVFFKRLGTPGVVGAAGAVLTRQRSLAVDNRYIPYGLPLFLETELPPLPGQPPSPFRRLLVAQDTGGAIKGPVRGDIFFGEGSEAEYLAGYMKGRGAYSLLIPKEIEGQLSR